MAHDACESASTPPPDSFLPGVPASGSPDLAQLLLQGRQMLADLPSDLADQLVHEVQQSDTLLGNSLRARLPPMLPSVSWSDQRGRRPGMPLLEVLRRFNLDDEVEQLAMNGIKRDGDLDYLDGDVINQLSLSPMTTAKLRALWRWWSSQDPERADDIEQLQKNHAQLREQVETLKAVVKTLSSSIEIVLAKMQANSRVGKTRALERARSEVRTLVTLSRMGMRAKQNSLGSSGKWDPRIDPEYSDRFQDSRTPGASQERARQVHPHDPHRDCDVSEEFLPFHLDANDKQADKKVRLDISSEGQDSALESGSAVGYSSTAANESAGSMPNEGSEGRQDADAVTANKPINAMQAMRLQRSQKSMKNLNRCLLKDWNWDQPEVWLKNKRNGKKRPRRSCRVRVCVSLRASSLHWHLASLSLPFSVCICMCVCVCARARARVRVCVCAWPREVLHCTGFASLFNDTNVFGWPVSQHMAPLHTWLCNLASGAPAASPV